MAELESRSSFIITSHARPDGDAVGSVLASMHMLRAMGKRADVVLHDPVPQIYRKLPGIEFLRQTDRVDGDYDAALVLECDSLYRSRVQGLEKYYLINIDHHDTARLYADVNWVDPEAPATAELIYRIAKAFKVEISPAMATCLYSAMLADTGSFRYRGTRGSTFSFARELVQKGADPVEIATSLYLSYSAAKMKLLGLALGTLEQRGAFAWMHVTRAGIASTGALDEDCEGLVNYALGIEGVQVAAFFRETSDGGLRVSLRSKGAVDVAKAAEQFGGGGHRCAGGCPIAGPLDKAVAAILAELKKQGFCPDGHC
jgi:phosphoesterase RecJ-like protein